MTDKMTATTNKVMAVAFDFAGVLGSSPRWKAWLESRFPHADIPALARKRVDWMEGRISLLDFWDAVEGVCPGSKRFMNEVEFDLKPNREMKALVSELRRSNPGLKLGILSNVGREKANAVKGMYPNMDFYIFSFELGLSKPDQDAFRLACSRIGFPCSKVLLVDDKPENVRSAVGAGMKALLFDGDVEKLKARLGMLGLF